MVVAMRKKLQVPLETVAIEATAMENAINFTRDIGIQKVMFESDSLLICFVIQGKIEAPMAIANLISVTKGHLQYFHQAEVCHMRREGNKAAHGLTKHAQFVEDFVTWMEETPSIINSEVFSDVFQFFSALKCNNIMVFLSKKKKNSSIHRCKATHTN